MASIESADLPSYLKEKKGERMLSIHEMLEKRSSKFKEFEFLSNPYRKELQKEYSRISKRVNDIKITEKIHVRYDEHDPIF